MTEEPRIIQIISGEGWEAVYSQSGGPESIEPVVCFALVEVKENGETWTEVRPMDVDDNRITFCVECENFARVQRRETVEKQ
jgi:hypothetical protein